MNFSRLDLYEAKDSTLRALIFISFHSEMNYGGDGGRGGVRDGGRGGFRKSSLFSKFGCLLVRLLCYVECVHSEKQKENIDVVMVSF